MMRQATQHMAETKELTSTAKSRSYCTMTSLLAPSATPAITECRDSDSPAAATPMVALEQQAHERQRAKQDGAAVEATGRHTEFGLPLESRRERDAACIGSVGAAAPGISGLESISATTAAFMTKLAALSTTSTTRKPMPNVNVANGNSLRFSVRVASEKSVIHMDSFQLTKALAKPRPRLCHLANESMQRQEGHLQQKY